MPETDGPGARARAEAGVGCIADGDADPHSIGPRGCASRPRAGAITGGIAPDAATAIGFGDRLQPRKLKVWKWTPVRRGALAGFASVELSIGLRLFDLPVFSSGKSGPWVGLPRRPQLDRERRQRIDINGNPEFELVAEWRDRATSEAFSRAVLAELLAKFPDALDQADPPKKTQTQQVRQAALELEVGR